MSADAARRTALAAQGFARPRPTGRVTRQHLRRVLGDVGLIQVDSVNVLVRSQELPVFSRLGPHPRSLIPDAAESGELFEYWAHACSLVPAAHHRLWRWKMAAEAEALAAGRRAGLADRLLAQLRERGRIAVGDFEGRVRTPGGSWWDWDDTKITIEHLFSAGAVTALRRRRDFARLYDLPERVLPASVLGADTPAKADACRELVLLAARSLGVATVADLADYHHLRATAVKPLVDRLVADGALVPVAVDGWARPAVLHPDAATPRRIGARSVLSPFDSLVWTRDRTERLFGFHYRIEIYTPAPQRRYGYYTLPFLFDGHLVGRVDLKADRAAGVLRAQATHVEDDLDPPLERAEIAEALLAELKSLGGWLGLASVGAVERGNLAADLLAAGAERLGA